MPSDRTLHLLVVGDDPTLEDELRTALDAVPNHHVIVHQAHDLLQALDVARSRQPQLVLLAIGRRSDDLVQMARELHEEVPGIVIAGVFQENRLASPDAERRVIIEAVRARVADFLRRPLSSTELRQWLDRATASSHARPAHAGRVVSFISNKGGVGKSTLSVSTACLLAERHPGRVLLIDMSLQLGICAMMLDLPPTTSIVNAVRQKNRLDERLLIELSLTHASGLKLLAAPADAMEATEITEEAIARIVNLARRAFDYVVIDTFPLLDEVVMAALDLSDLVFVVSQGTVPSLVGTAKLLPVLEHFGVTAPRQRLVVNHNYRRFAGQLGPADIESRLGRPLDHVIPYQKRLLVAMNTGDPYILHATRRFGAGRAIVGIAAEIELTASAATAPAADAPPRAARALADAVAEDTPS